MWAWFTGPKLPGVDSIVAQKDQLRERIIEWDRQQHRIAAANAIMVRIRTASGSTTLRQLLEALNDIRPFATKAGDGLVSTLMTMMDKFGEDVALREPLPTDVAVHITTNMLCEANAVIAAADVEAASLRPPFESVAQYRVDTMGRGDPVVDIARLPLSDATGKRLCTALIQNPFVAILDLSGCYPTATLVEDDVLPAVAVMQHLTFLGLSRNRLPVTLGATLATALEDADFCPALQAVAVDGNDFFAEDVARIEQALCRRRRERAVRQRTHKGDVSGKPCRTLCLDGGGMQAVLQLEWLEQQQAEYAASGDPRGRELRPHRRVGLGRRAGVRDRAASAALCNR
jgi:hypothetical protein